MINIVQTCFGLFAGAVVPFLFAVPAVAVFTVLSPLTALVSGIIFILYVFLGQVVLRAFPENERHTRAFFILGISSLLLMASLFLSEKSYFATDIAHQTVYATAGFPVPAFNLSSADNPTSDQWSRFLIDWAV